jgi:tryptophanase
MKFKTIIEPFRIKAVEPIRQTTREEREKLLADAHYNLFLLKAEDVLIDLLTDSGTGAMSSSQWAGMMLGDESYAGSRSFYKFEGTVKLITGFKHVLPTHQGRGMCCTILSCPTTYFFCAYYPFCFVVVVLSAAFNVAAERILFGCTLKPGYVVPNNTHFDTTRANVEYRGAKAIDILIPEGRAPALIHPFKGNMDLEALECLLENDQSSGEKKIPMVFITVTNNSNGGQPVSMANIRGASEICHRYNVPLFFDAARFAENAYFIKIREDGYADKTPMEIAQEMFHYVDGATMSAKKDGMSNIGGFLAVNDDDLAQQCTNMLILTEGFSTYGGLAGYDLEALAVGLKEALEEDYLHYRIRSVAYLGEELTKCGIPIVQPTGGHAIYIDAKAMLPHIPPDQYPAWALTLALYLEGGIRSVEIGSVMFDHINTNNSSSSDDDDDEEERPATLELVRLAFPRRVYTQSHVDYVAEVLRHVNSIKDTIRGVRIVEAPSMLRHFSAKMALVEY